MDYSELKRMMQPYGCVSTRVVNYLQDKTGLSLEELSAEELNKYLQTVNNPAEYFDSTGNSVEKDSDKVSYVWVSTPYTDRYSKEPLIIGFHNHTGLEMVGYFVGSRKRALNSLNAYLAEDESEKSPKSFLNKLYDSLLLKDAWNKLPKNKILETLIHICESRIQEHPEYCIKNESGTEICYNTGLLDIYGNDILILKKDIDGSVYRDLSPSKTQLKQDGFAEVKCAPIQFYQNREELIFKASIDDFDLEDVGRLKHVLDSRIERFPKECQSQGCDVLFQKIRSSMEFDLKMIVRNPYWAAAFYNVKQDSIQHMFPLYITKSFAETPDLAMIVSKGEHFYEVKTVIKLEDAYANAVCLATPPSEWLQSSVNRLDFT